MTGKSLHRMPVAEQTESWGMHVAHQAESTTEESDHPSLGVNGLNSLYKRIGPCDAAERPDCHHANELPNLE